ncbi:hypothetical protein [Sphaerisporangium rufum]|uniref:hypothetical protein n=1 Tax=Sphaerisporangium rufum TaxID=1381558 RepID=UPI00194F04C1|nr:hypothetical protein [Sphaerisporangium rufum]
MPAVLVGAVSLLFADWLLAAAILGSDCVVADGGNLTECGGGFSEEETSAVSGLATMAMFVLQAGVGILVARRVRAGLR